MDQEYWHGVLGQLSPNEPRNVDDLTGHKAKTTAPKRWDHTNDVPKPSPKLWDLNTEEVSYFGIHVDEPAEDLAGLAAKLAACALERNVIPIVLTTLERSGLERFGFRVEYVGADNAEEQARMIEEVSAFWNLAIRINASDVQSLG